MGKFLRYISIILVSYLFTSAEAEGQSQFAKKFYGSGAPGSVLQSRYGDIYVRTSDSSFYICTNVASYCNGVGVGQWQLSAGGGGGSGTVTSVALTMPGIFAVGGSPVTTTGTLAVTLNSQSANLFWASPDGLAGTPTFRSLVLGDFSANLITNAKLATMPANTVKCNNTGASATAIDCTVAQIKTLLAYQTSDLSDASTIVKNNQANTYSGGGLQDFSAMKIKPGATTVAGLPAAAANANVVYLVTNGNSASDCSSGGGTTLVWCGSNGSSWSALGGSGGGGFNDPGSNGIVVRTALNTSVARTLTAGSAKITITNGTGVVGNPTVDLGSVATGDLSDGANVVKNNQANTYSGGGLQDFSGMKVKPGATTVVGLPSAATNTNVVYLVTDAASLTDCTGGGGSTRTWCVSNGSAWVATTASSTGLGDPGSNGVVYRNGAGTSTPATASNLSTPHYCASSNGTESYTCNLSPAIAAYTTGDLYFLKTDVANPAGSTSVNFNAVGVKNIYTPDGVPARSNTIRAGALIALLYDGTNMVMVSQWSSSVLPEVAKSSLPAGMASGYKIIVNNGLTTTDCLSGASGSGGYKVICEYNGSAWRALGTLDDITYPQDFAQAFWNTSNALTQYTLVESDGSTAYGIKAALSGSTTVQGVALQGAAGAQAQGVQYSGTVRCVADNTVTAWNLIGVGTTTAGRCRDLGTKDPKAVAYNVQIIGVAVTAATVGNQFAVRLYNAPMMGLRPIQYIVHSFDGGGATLTAATSVGKYVDFACTIDKVVMEGDQSGTVAVTIARAAYATTPSYSTISSGAGITAAVASKDTTLSGWTTSVAADSLIRAQITGTPTSMQKLTITIRCI